MPECLACESEFIQSDSDSTMPYQYCSLNCETIFEQELKDRAEESKARGLVDNEGTSILGGAYQQAVARTVREAILQSQQPTGQPVISIMNPKKGE